MNRVALQYYVDKKLEAKFCSRQLTLTPRTQLGF